MSITKTVVISSAGMGTRLGMNLPKAMIDLHGKKLIEWQLDLLNDVEDVRVVVGYKYQCVIDVVTKLRPDCTFVFNRDYRTTGTADSYVKGALFSDPKSLIISLDGDLLVHPEDFEKLLSTPHPCIGVGQKTTEEPVFVSTFLQNENEMAHSFSRIHGDYEWVGLAQLYYGNVKGFSGYVYQLIEPLLPLPIIKVRTQEIDTYADYERALSWVKDILI